MGCAYKRRDRVFEARIARLAEERRDSREAEEIAEMVREVEQELIPLLILLWELRKRERS